jgi:hypothetical protein
MAIAYRSDHVRRPAWTDTVRVLSLVVTAFFFAAAVLQAVLSFELTGAAPQDTEDFIESIIAFFNWENGRAGIDLAASLLFGFGFVAVAGLGVLLSRLADRADVRGALAAAGFIGGGALGLASQLWWIAVKPLATDPHYCECNLRAEEITSRLMILRLGGTVQLWLVIGAIVLVSIGIVVAVRLVQSAGMPSGWAWLSYLVVAGSFVSSGLGIAGTYPFDQIALLVVAGALIPLWALWLAIRAPSLRGPESGPAPAPV